MFRVDEATTKNYQRFDSDNNTIYLQGSAITRCVFERDKSNNNKRTDNQVNTSNTKWNGGVVIPYARTPYIVEIY